MGNSGQDEIVIYANGHVHQSNKSWLDLKIVCGVFPEGADVEVGHACHSINSLFHFMDALRIPDIVVGDEVVDVRKGEDKLSTPSICIHLFPHRWARSQVLLLNRGVFAPSPYICDNDISINIKSNEISYEIDGGQVGRWVYWYAPWSATHHENVGGAVGVALFLKRAFLHRHLLKHGGSTKMFGHLTSCSRKDEFGEWGADEIEASINLKI